MKIKNVRTNKMNVIFKWLQRNDLEQRFCSGYRLYECRLFWHFHKYLNIFSLENCTSDWLKSSKPFPIGLETPIERHLANINAKTCPKLAFISYYNGDVMSGKNAKMMFWLLLSVQGNSINISNEYQTERETILLR